MTISRKRLFHSNLNNPENRLQHNDDSNLSMSSDKKKEVDDEDEDMEEGEEESAADSDTGMDYLNDQVRLNDPVYSVHVVHYYLVRNYIWVQ